MCDPKRLVRGVALAVWSRRMAIFYAVSAASLAGNLVVLAASLEVWSGLHAVLLHMLVPQLIELFELLMQRPVLYIYILLNLILLRIVVKSGVLGGPSKKLESDDGGFPGINRLQRPQLHVDGGLHGELNHGVERSPGSQHKHNHAVEATGNEQMSISVLFLKKQASMVFTVETDPSAKEAALSAADHDLPRDEADQKPEERWVASKKEPAKAEQLPKRPSLFTIEPLEMVTEPPAALMGAGLAVDLHATLVGAGQQDMDEIYMNIKAASAEACGKQTAAMATPNRNLVTERRLINGGADGRPRPDDHELSRQEFEQRVDTFICKFKRNLTMQRQDSLNRLLGFLAGGEITLRS